MSKPDGHTAPLTKNRSGQSVQPVLIAGPTATGKSAIALELAERIEGEIVSVDSMQVYRGLDIAAAKPSPGERQAIPHHLIDVVDLTEAFDAARFVELAAAAVDEIQDRGRVPILCGGTGLYFKAYLQGVGETPAPNAALRAQLEAAPLVELLRELEKRDPVTFARIDKKNPRRVIRALEVIRLTGNPVSAQRAVWIPAGGRGQEQLFIGLTRAWDDLRARIDARVEEMFARGLVLETRELLGRGLARNRTAMQAIGYRQVVEHLRGARTLTDTVSLVKQKTRQFAKRQLTWFRRQVELEWISLGPADSPADIAEGIAGRWRKLRLSSLSKRAIVRPMEHNR